MKKSLLISVAFAVLVLMGCSSVKTPKAEIASHDSDHNIPSIDQMIGEMKQDYIEKCYMPVAMREPPTNACQTELFQMLERRYHTNYNQNNVSQASNDLFFKDVGEEIKKMVRTDPQVREAIRSGAFRSTDEMQAY